LVFNASSSNGSIVDYAWDFGDGNITTVPEPVVSHRYSSNGTYLVTLNVTDNSGSWNTTSYQIKVTFQTDLNKDGVVNILDIFIVAQAFGSKPGDSNWNVTADVNEDGTVNILDIFAVAWDFGKTV
jgi:PKD repeat protein